MQAPGQYGPCPTHHLTPSPPARGLLDERLAPAIDARRTLQQIQRRTILSLHLCERAILRRLFRTPPQELRSVPKTPAGEVIELHLHHQLGRYRLPFHGALGAPPAQAPGRLPRKSRRLDHAFKFFRQCRAILIFNRRRKSHVIELSLIVVKAEEQRTDQRFLFKVTKTSDNAVGG